MIPFLPLLSVRVPGLFCLVLARNLTLFGGSLSWTPTQGTAILMTPKRQRERDGFENRRRCTAPGRSGGHQKSAGTALRQRRNSRRPIERCTRDVTAQTT